MQHGPVNRRGTLRIYLGASPGVGKTYAMLNEGFRRRERGADVVVGVVETHGRASTAEQLRDLEVIPRRTVEYRGTTLTEMDVDAIIARRPTLVLVDEYAHTNAPGSRNEKRWQDVEQLLDAGIDVVSTLNIQHLESLNDVIAKITGTIQRETVPDAVVRRSADQIELVDMSPEALRRRMAHGNIYPAERIDAALSNYFRPGNLGALRELALLWVADRVEEALSTYLADHGIESTWETRERVVVGLTGRPGGEALIRRAARMAGRLKGDLVAVHVSSADGLSESTATAFAEQRRLVEELGGTVREVVGDDPAATLVEFAHAEKATQLVLGASERSRFHELVNGSFVAHIARLAGDMDVHIIGRRITDEGAAPALGVSAPRLGGVGRRRAIVGWLLLVMALPALTVATVGFREHVQLTTELLLHLAMVLAIAAVGGRLVGAAAAVVSSLLVNWFFVEPYHTLTIAEAENIVALAVFLAVAVTVGWAVDTAARRSIEAHRARVEAESLARAVGRVANERDPLPALVDEIRSTFGLARVTLVSTGPAGDRELATAIDPSADGDGPDVPAAELAIGDPTTMASLRLELAGRPLTADDRRLLRTLADQLLAALDRMQLAAEAAEAGELAEVDAVRTAILRSVSHDLRTPLATIKAMVSGLRDPTVDWTAAQIAEALAAVDEETDRLNGLVGNLLDASRLQIGALAIHATDAAVDDVVQGALRSLGATAAAVVVEQSGDLPLLHGDAALLERSLANVIANALRHAGDVAPVRVTSGVVGGRVAICVIDRGAGIPIADRDRVLAPFQQGGDQRRADDGVGLGLAIARGFVEAMGGALRLDDTPGGGLTVTIEVPAASPAPRPDEVTA